MLTANQLQRRKYYLGASEVAPILNLCPFRAAWSVWAEKKLNLKPQESNDKMDLGLFIESGLIQYACKKLDIKKVRKNQFRVSKNGVMSATLDALIVGKPEAIEIKTTGMWRQWGQDNTDEIPAHVMIQCQCQMFCADLELVHLFALMPGFNCFDFKYFPVKRNDEMIAKIEKKALEWWQMYMIDGKEPKVTDPPDMELINRIIREPNSYGTVKEETVRLYEKANRVLKKIEDIKELRKARLLAELGKNEAARLEDGRTVTYYEYSRGNSKFRKLNIK